MFSINPVVCLDRQGTGSCSSPSEGCWVPSPVQAPGASSGLLGSLASAGQLPLCPRSRGHHGVWGLWRLGDLSRPRSPVLFLLCSCFSYIWTFSGLIFFFLFNVLCCGHKVERLGSGHFSRTAVSTCLCVCSVTCIQKSAQMTNPGHFQKLNSPHLRVSS